MNRAPALVDAMMFLVNSQGKKNMFKKIQDYQETAQRQLAKLLHLFEGSWPASNLHPTIVCAKRHNDTSFANEPQGQVVAARGLAHQQTDLQKLDSSNAMVIIRDLLRNSDTTV